MSNSASQFIWERNALTSKASGKELKLKRPCSCGCDYRDGVKGVGYLIGSDGSNKGCTVWIKDEAVYAMLQKILDK